MSGLNFKQIKLSQESTNKLQQFKNKTGLTDNIACRLALGISLADGSIPSLDLFIDETGKDIKRYTLMGEHELVLESLFIQWCFENDILSEQYNKYFLAHINRGVEQLTNRVKGLEGLSQLLPRGH